MGSRLTKNADAIVSSADYHHRHFCSDAFLNVPDELLLLITSFVGDVGEVYRTLSTVSKVWVKNLDSTSFWKPFCRGRVSMEKQTTTNFKVRMSSREMDHILVVLMVITHENMMAMAMEWKCH